MLPRECIVDLLGGRGSRRCGENFTGWNGPGQHMKSRKTCVETRGEEIKHDRSHSRGMLRLHQQDRARCALQTIMKMTV